MSLSEKLSVFIALVITLVALVNAQNCVPRYFGHGSIVCVCNATYCDTMPVSIPKKGEYQSYETSKSGKRMSGRSGRFDDPTEDNIEFEGVPFTLHPDEVFQTMHGFGGAFTDSTGINMRKLSKGAQDRIIESYFGANGSSYNLGRVPIGGTDFSTRPYTLDDNDGDVTLSKFHLAREDYLYKIPLMQKARELSPNLKFVSAAWTAPSWMKTNHNYTGFGALKEEYYQVYANYLVKFLTEYQMNGLDIWAITTGNEPTDALATYVRFNTMAWTPDNMAVWVAENLGPTIASSNSSDTIIMILDDQRFDLPWYVVDVFRNPTAQNYTAGIALHWYFDAVIVPDVMNDTHYMYPDKFLLMTEGCVGSQPWELEKVILGSWNRAERYILDIMQNLNYWITGFIDWNLVLDQQGGPNYVKNYVDAAIIVHPENDEFFKQPIYYVLAHFSKFITPGSTRIGITGGSETIEAVAFSTIDDEIVVVLYNGGPEEYLIRITDSAQGNITTTISPLSIQTIFYKQ